jgi:hypothetical protein
MRRHCGDGPAPGLCPSIGPGAFFFVDRLAVVDYTAASGDGAAKERESSSVFMMNCRPWRIIIWSCSI